MNRNLIYGLIVAVAAVAGGTYMLTRDAGPTLPSMAAVAQDSGDAAELPEVIEMTLGNPDASVTVIEYASFTCPHCKNFHDAVFDDLKANYIDTGKINFIYREVYFDKYGLWAGMVARCSGPTRYFGVADLLYDQQADWLASRTDAGIAGDLRKLGLTAGIEAEQLDACLADGAKAQAMVATYQQNATADDVSSTPTFIINGEKYSNMNYESFSAILDGLL